MNLKDLVQYLQRAKNSNGPISTSHIQKLSSSAQELIDIGNGAATTLSLTDSYILMTDAAVIPGASYIITAVNESLYGGTEIIVTGLSNSILSKQGYGVFYNPNYEIGMWNYNNSYNIGDKTIFGGMVWTNVTGNVGNFTDVLHLGTDWAVVAYNNTDYTIAYDYIEYDWINDTIITREETYGDNLVSCVYTASDWFLCGISPIAAFKWGAIYNGTTGISGCKIINSFFLCANVDNTSSITNVEMSGFSMVAIFDMDTNSYIDSLKISNYSGIEGIVLSNSYMESVTLETGSGMSEITLTNSNISYFVASNYSWLDNVDLTGSYLQYCTLMNSSSLDSITLINSYMETIFLNNGSNCNNITLTNSNFYQIDVDKGYITTVNLTSDGSVIKDITINTASLQHINSTISPYYLHDCEYINTEQSYSAFADIAGEENGSECRFNTMKYQFHLDLSGLTAGAVTIPPFTIPYGFYVHSIIVDATEITMPKGDSYLTMGINNDKIDAALNSTTGLLRELSGLITVFNGTSVDTTKASANQQLTATLSDSVTSGSMDIELVIKRTFFNYGNS